ncbi:DUF1616 domain-containing protein [Natronosalvus rutilus]|uniref:DUF1616 domain-containing protein n=1 Tax=Natronosalvus rutilus TaxID=2953753 RepID=A0A9E7NCK9_9EURY|nr:DUF1616 domain-containing protein [Natronosalvus rutilus]UTF55006.1 DUF1616 domain-containing protein [Natronosalvus rutilus]
MSLTTKTQNTVGAVGRYPTDLAFVTLATVLAYVLVTNLSPGSGLRLLSALAFVSFLPGYALVSMLFPVRARARAPGPQATAEARPGGIDAAERLALGLGLSIAVVPIVVLALPLTRWGLTVGSTIGALAAVTVVAAQLAVIRRLRVPPADRFTVSLAGLRKRFSSANETGAARASSLLLGLAIIAAVGVLLYSFTAPMAAGGFTQLAIYTAEGDGDLEAEMPDTVAPGDSIPITFQIHNEEGREMEYTVVMQEQVVADGEVVERVTHQEVTAISQSGDGGQITAERSVAPAAGDGETVRIAVMLFEGDAPETATMEEATEYTYFWVTVETPPDAPGSGGADDGGEESGADADGAEGGDGSDDTGDEAEADGEDGEDDDGTEESDESESDEGSSEGGDESEDDGGDEDETDEGSDEEEGSEGGDEDESEDGDDGEEDGGEDEEADEDEDGGEDEE